MLYSKLLATQKPSAGGAEPEGVSFDGVTDYLSRSTDLVGNVDSKTFTFSCWVYHDGTEGLLIGESAGAKYLLRVSTNVITGIFRNSANVIVLSFDVYTPAIPKYQWNHIHISIDLSNSLNRYIYLNDIITTPTWTTFINDFCDFTHTSHSIGGGAGGSDKLKGRLSNLFLKYTYYDLIIEANRRLFITADGKPADGLASLNPILYLPMKDAATAHINEGTGGNFVQNGVLDTASRGANQDNCVASYFDGVADYLSKGNVFTDSNKFTYSCIMKNQDTAQFRTLNFNTGASESCTFELDGEGKIAFRGYNSTASFLFGFNGFTSYKDKIVTIQISVDLSDVTKRHIYVNGQIPLGNWNLTYVNNPIDFSVSNVFIGKGTSAYTQGSIGELYFDTTYIDLATNNPFWDSDTNKPIPARKAMETLGSTPLICMPIDASNAGKNYGTGGDFTVNSAPFVGARGASEYIARSALRSGLSTLSRGSLGVGLGSKTLSLVACLSAASLSSYPIVTMGDTTSANSFNIETSIDSKAGVEIKNSIGTTIARFETTSNIVTLGINKFQTVLINIDTTSTSNCRIIINGTSYALTFTNLINDFMDLDYPYTRVTERATVNKTYSVSSMYMSTDHIDFSQEVNRNLFVDQLGYPKDLKAQIDKGLIPEPLIYLPFDDTDNLGKNLGAGGDFSVVGTVTAGSDFTL